MDDLTLNINESMLVAAEQPAVDLPKAPKFTPSLNRVQKITDKGQWEYELFKVLDEYNPALRTLAFAWDYQDPPGDLRYIGISLIQTMVKHHGLGLAAPQVGLPYRIFAMGAGDYGSVVVNPEIINRYGDDLAPEGCLSMPGLILKIRRAAKVDVRYWDWNWKVHEQTFDGLSARVFLHEYDHLDGVLFTSLVSKVVLAHERGKVKVNLRKMRREIERQQVQDRVRAQIHEAAKAEADRRMAALGTTVSLSNNTIQLNTSSVLQQPDWLKQGG